MAAVHNEVKDLVVQIVLDELSGTICTKQSDPVIEYIALKRKKPSVLLGTARIENYVEETVPRYSDPLFRAHFRMTRTSFQVNILVT